MDEFDIVDKHFDFIYGQPESTHSDTDKAFLEVWHTFGVIQKSGLHNYLCDAFEEVPLIISYYRSLELTKCADTLSLAMDLLSDYRSTLEGELCSEGFRLKFEDELNSLEDGFYDEEDNMTKLLVASIPLQNRLT